MQTQPSPLERYVARLKEERDVLDRLLHQLEVESTIADKQIRSTSEWIEQVRLRIAEIDDFLAAIESA